MKQSLQLKIGQSLAMTPQLQQAIRLLQLPTIELQAEIQQIIESNPMLDLDDEIQNDDKNNENNNEDKNAVESDTSTSDSYDDDNTEFEINQANNQEFSDDDALKNPWENNITQTQKLSKSQSEQPRDLFENHGETGSSLNEHLLWQLNLSSLTQRDHLIATTIIDAINDDGYLTENIDDIFAALQQQDEELEKDEVLAVLNFVQNLDPIGVAAANTSECLTLQLNSFAEATPALAVAKDIVQNYIELLANRDYARLRKMTKADDNLLKEAEKIIQSLNPRPGACVNKARIEYIVPDVYVGKHKGQWRVSLNPDLSPKVNINNTYANLIKRADKSDQNVFLKNNLQEARWFLKSLESRNDTILKVATCIVERQHAFLDYGEEAMKPLVLRDIAETLDMHESTISRVTNQKYMHTPRGIFEFKYFFSSHVSTADGGECSATAIRAVIKKLIAEENTAKPLSDSKIANILADQGINVARRTVAKYRESLLIPASNERKRLM